MLTRLRLKIPVVGLLTLFLILLLDTEEISGQYKTERPKYDAWLNYGSKKIKPGRETENDIIKSKVEVLGQILKKHVHKLRQVPGQRIELVFLVDSSASVGAENFFNEIKFVRKLLADFTVSYNETRVAVVTFSSKNKVIRHIDHVTQASIYNHKCRLLDLQLPEIKYSGGGTYTLGAMLEAQSVLALSRKDTVKAVFLVTDGYSNGGDPRPAAAHLRSRDVIIFTFGIRNGNVKELHDMASEPKEEHSYILDSFEEFEALARRALHEDLQSGSLVKQDDVACDKLCPQGQDCCDAYGTCTCGTHTGFYACTCRPGYYGSGLQGDCKPCPSGTYRDVQGPGDVTTCKPCPDTNMISEEGSTSALQCYCNRGFKQIGLQCTVLQCPLLTPPENGFFVRNTCNNVVNAACGIRCDPGFRLEGSSIRLCKEDGTWSGGDAKCVMKSCPALKSPKNGVMVCTRQASIMDTECHFACDPGYLLVGSKMRTCLPVAMWDGIPAYCKPIYCQPLPKLRHGTAKPSTCLTSKSKYGTRCEFKCEDGYQLQGSYKATCVDPGVWTNEEKWPRCVDIQPPGIVCPKNITANTEPRENYANVTWEPAKAKDNSRVDVKLSTIPATTQPMLLRLGTHVITYLAIDSQGNKASCQFGITVIDDEPPRIDLCESPPVFLSSEKVVDVYWEEPIFSDNSGGKIKVQRSKEPGRFPQGDTLVEYFAEDESGNKASCNITITVQKHACQMPLDPINGASNCTEDLNAVYCSMTCNDGYAFAMRPQQDYFCAYDGLWLPENNPMPFPDCSITSVPNSIAQSGEIALDNEGSVCDDIFYMGQVENQLERKLEEALSAMCADNVVCEVAAVEAVCENILAEAEEEFNSLSHFRRKRGASDMVYYYSEDSDGRKWKYWFRDEVKATSRSKRSVSLDKENEDLHRRKRFFSSFFPHKEDEIVKEHHTESDKNYLGGLIDIIATSFASDIGLVRFSSFLTNLEKENGGQSVDEFFSAFAKEFGDEKAAYLREIASKRLQGMELPSLPGISVNRTERDDIIFPDIGQTRNSFGEHHNDFSQIIKNDDNEYEEFPHIDQVNGFEFGQESSPWEIEQSSSQILEEKHKESEKQFKLRFQLTGQGDDAQKVMTSLMDGIMKDAQTGKFDISVGNRQLQLAAIRLSEDPEYLCDPGSVLRKNICVKCPVGTFFNVILKDCEPCPQGSYQNEEGQVSCIVCPENTSTSTLEGLAKNGSYCKAQCLPGTFAKDGLEPCATCPHGEFQDEYSSTGCVACPYGTTTWRRGSWVVEECKPACTPGEVSETGLKPCYPCPAGYFQDDQGQHSCFRCPNGGTTNGTGSSSIFHCHGATKKDQAAFSTLETLRINDCFSVPCENGATCTPTDLSYICSCMPGYTGQQCETEINECETEPCQHNGTCHDLLNEYHCDCPSGFSGISCEENINECSPDPCQNGGTCVDLVDGFKCVCIFGYTGEVCDMQVDECEPNPCLNGATCLDALNDYTCVCAPGYTGRQCETQINECDSSPCVKGVCVDQIDAFRCVCPEGYTGDICDVNINECEPDPCSNGGTCQDWINGFSCTCAPGYTGKGCEIEMATDFVMEFSSSSTINYAILETLPRVLSEITLCFWMRSSDRDNYGTPFSYATTEYDNALTLTDYSGFVFYVNGDKRITDVRVNDGQWHMICGTWMSVNGSWAVFMDGVPMDSGVGLAAGTFIEDSGVIVLGQEQDRRGGMYSPQESFIGDLSLLNIWGEAFQPTKITELHLSCHRYIGDIKAWPDFQAGIKGKIRTKSSPFCRGCGVPSSPPNGHIEEISPGAEVRVTCNKGYKLYQGDEVRRCQVQGTWSGEEPMCQRTSCGFPELLMNGNMVGNSYYYGDKMTYSCNPGFKMHGPSNRYCGEDGQWEGEMPTCEIVECPKVENPTHGKALSFLSIYMPTNQIAFTCEKGYQMDGPAVLTCGNDGEWDTDKPRCQPDSCGEMPVIENGKIEGSSSTGLGSTLKVECDDGYKLDGDAVITCKDDGTWSKPLPRCKPPHCPKPPKVENGRVKVRASATSKEAVYYCNKGYTLVGKKVISCDADGVWNAPWSYCEGKKCHEPRSIEHGQFQSEKKWEVGSVVVYSCEIGYQLEGKGTVECIDGGDEGSWASEQPSCKPVKCPDVVKVPFGSFTVTHQPSTDLVIDDLLLGSPTEVALRFERSIEGFPSVSFGGQSEFSQYHGGDYEDFSQSQGGSDFEDFSQSQGGGDYEGFSQSQGGGDYESFSQSQGGSDYEGFSQFQGGSDYEFSQSQGGSYDYGLSQSQGHFSQSSQWDYDISQQSSGAQLYKIDYYYGTEIEYDCQPGYKLIGGSKRTCAATGEWDTPSPICYESYCNELDALENGHMTYHGSGQNSRVTYSCNSGYELVGEFESVCQADRKWQGEMPECKMIDCGEPRALENGTVEFISTQFGSVATYDCFVGFVLEGSFERFCVLEGFWNGSMPRCVATTCKVPPVIDDGYITFEGSLYVNSPIEYECKECYELIGPRFRYCQVDGTWDLQDPTCNLIYCDPLPSEIKNGKIIGDDHHCGSLVEFTCNPGHELKGSRTATCQEEKVWSSPLPTCESVSCGPPEPISNGKISGSDYTFSNKISYECNEGYVLQGLSLRVCQENGYWSDSTPYCAIVNCSKPVGPANGKVRLGGLYYGADAKIVCDPGYKLDGAKYIKCGADGQWNQEMPFCLPIICPPAPQIPNGSYNSTEVQFEALTYLLYTCHPGYYTNAMKSELLCNAKGEWESEVIECLPVDCGDPGTLPNGKIIGSTYTYGNSISFECDEGFELIGGPSTECLADGSWSNYATSCSKITCKAPELLLFGKMKAQTENIYGSKVQYECDKGYIFSGSEVRECDVNGEWTGVMPECKPTSCPALYDVLHAEREGDIFEYSKVIKYKCKDGFNLQGSETLTCRHDGTWSDETPFCEMITCLPPLDIKYGKWEWKKMTDLPYKTQPQKKGYAKGRKKGHSKGRSKSAKLVTTLLTQYEEGPIYKFRDIIEYTCDTGYSMLSENLLECTSEGWNVSVPQCHPVTCPIPIQIRNGRVIGEDYTYNSVLRYKCNEGYELIGENSRICQENKEWSEEEPFCRIIECPRPALLDNGQMLGSSIKYKSVLTYTCDHGFRLEGVTSRTCQSNGYWTDDQPECVEVFCDLPEHVSHSVVDIVSLKVGGVVRYTCMEGFRLEGFPIINCLMSGLWDKDIPRCAQIDCGPPPSAPNVVTIGPDTVYGAQVTYDCKRGYQLIGTEWSTCLGSGRWSHDAPLCREILCPPPVAPLHGYVKSLGDQVGEIENIKVPPTTQGKGQKGRKGGKTTKSHTGFGKLVEKLYYVDDKIVYECEDGFKEEGETIASCGLDGLWSSMPPRCQRILCKPPELPEYGLIEGEDYSYGSYVTYNCREGYELQGVSNQSCEADGSWSDNTPSCQPVSCGPITPLDHARFTFLLAQHKLPHHYGSSAVVECDDGYELTGGKYKVCEADGIWKGEDSVCIEMLCSETTPIVNNTLVVVQSEARPQTADYSCEHGYLIQGETEIVCSFGNWSSPNISCIPVNCGEPPIPLNGKITAKHFQYGSVANYTCMDGYHLVGNPSIFCDHDGFWKGSLPECQPVDCGIPEGPENGEVENTHTEYGAQALYYCNEGYQLFGNDTRTCLASGEWSDNMPQCHRVSCGELEPPSKGFIMGVSYLYGDLIRFGCEKGHVLEGKAEAFCDASGQWTATPPDCRAVTCHGSPRSPPNSIPVTGVTSGQYDDEIPNVCQQGYLARGDLRSRCQENGQWSKPPGQCSKISCGRPKVNRDGTIILGRSFYYNDKVTYRCPPGKFPKNGSSTVLTCLGDGSWSGIPSCVGRCAKKCLNGGLCVKNNVCSCKPGFVGSNCQYALCILPCLNGGTCVGPYKCRCAAGYTGQRCQKPVCEQGCSGGGRCIGPNICHCSFGYIGPSCDNTGNNYDLGHSQNEELPTTNEDWELAGLRRRRRRRRRQRAEH
ncbi:sushi, von Willebrand factor type A, EGF and pentraxin domain-containing protein 1-like [Oratosquilla oratoria]|uniref:sushi, von Willebrand factor type A, EGF and pentraxin domain-containing protein 1-like n=1 Tax=Oratosquilla oratoria TaxID=337810 RepID=UPI003F76C79F